MIYIKAVATGQGLFRWRQDKDTVEFDEKCAQVFGFEADNLEVGDTDCTAVGDIEEDFEMDQSSEDELEESGEESRAEDEDQEVLLVPNQ